MSIESFSIGLAWTGGALVAATALRWLLLFLVQKYLENRRTIPSDLSLSRHYSPAVWLLFSCLGLQIVFPFVPLSDEWAWGGDRVLQILTIVFGTWVLVRTVTFFRRVIFFRMSSDGSDDLRLRKMRTQIEFVERFLVIAFTVLGFSLVLMSFEGARKIGGSLIASAGLAGVILGFAAQKSLGNLIAGFQIAFTQPIRIDDVVIVEGEWGRIEEITLTYVIVRIWDRRALVVPITYFVEKPFQNWTRSSSDLLGAVLLYLDYGTDVDRLRQEFMSIVRDNPNWDGKVAVLQVVDATEKTMQIRALVSAADSGKAFSLRCDLREKMIDYLRREQPGAIPQVRVASPAQAAFDA